MLCNGSLERNLAGSPSGVEGVAGGCHAGNFFCLHDLGVWLSSNQRHLQGVTAGKSFLIASSKSPCQGPCWGPRSCLFSSWDYTSVRMNYSGQTSANLPFPVRNPV